MKSIELIISSSVKFKLSDSKIIMLINSKVKISTQKWKTPKKQ
jgi:hypothetical protein